jgi:hypothetical protein
MRPMPRTCLFCPAEANMTGEHVWSGWIGAALGSIGFNFARRNAEGSVNVWRHKELDLKAKLTCGPCNNGWMSDLEERTKPILLDIILHGSPKAFTPHDIAVVSAFAYKSAILASGMYSKSLSFFSEKDRYSFAETLRIPSGVYMWLAMLPNRHRGVFKSDGISTANDFPHSFELNSFTYSAGHFVVQVLSSHWRERARRRHDPPLTFWQNPVWDRASIPFWPHLGTVVHWPPATHLLDDSLKTFINRWAFLEWHG